MWMVLQVCMITIFPLEMCRKCKKRNQKRPNNKKLQFLFPKLFETSRHTAVRYTHIFFLYFSFQVNEGVKFMALNRRHYVYMCLSQNEIVYGTAKKK